MKVADLLTALTELRAGRITVDQLIAACSAWSKEPTRPLADFIKPGPPAAPAPLVVPADEITFPAVSRRPAAPRRAAPATPSGPSRTVLLVAAGVALAAMIGMAVGLGYLGRSNAQLEAANAKLAAANADLEATKARLEQANADSAAGRGTADARRPAEPPREPKAVPKETGGKGSKTGVPPVAGKGSPPSSPPKAGKGRDLRALEDAHTRLRQSAGPADPRTLRAAADLGTALAEAGRPADALRLLEGVEKADLGHPDVRAAAVTLVHLLWATGQADRSIRLGERVRDELPVGDPFEPEVRTQLARAYRAAGRWDRAKPLLLDHLVFVRKTNGPDSPEAARALTWMAECLVKLGDAAGAEPLARESLDLRTQKGANEWPTFAAKSLLGEVLLAQKKPDQAEVLMTAGYDGLKARADQLPWDERAALADAAGRLARLYEARGDADKAAQWKKTAEQARGKK